MKLTVRDPNTPATPGLHDPAVTDLGRRADLDEQEQRAQPDVRRKRTGLDHLGRTAAGQSGILQGRIGSPVSEAARRSSARAASSRCTTRKSGKLTHISTCFSTHHLMFAEDSNNTLWTSGGGSVVGWLNTKMFEATGRRTEVPGLDRSDHGHQWQRQARRLRRTEPAGRSDERQTLWQRVLRGVAGSGRIGLGIRPRFPRRDHSSVAGRESTRDGAGGSIRTADEEWRAG